MDNNRPPLRQPRVTPEQLPEFNAYVRMMFGPSPAVPVTVPKPKPLPEKFQERFIATVVEGDIFRRALRKSLEVT